MIREAVILAGGMGTRLQGVIKSLPKAMAPVLERPFLEYQLAYLNKWGIRKVVLALGYRWEIVQKYFRGDYRGMKLDYSIESEPLGTGGALIKALEKTSSPYVLAMNGDTYFDVNLTKMHNERLAKEADVTIALSQVDDTFRYGSVEFDENRRITAFLEKGKKSGTGYVNGGIYLIRTACIMGLGMPEKFSLERDFFENHYKSSEMFGMICASYFLDIGVPSDYIKAQHELEGIII